MCRTARGWDLYVIHGRPCTGKICGLSYRAIEVSFCSAAKRSGYSWRNIRKIGEDVILVEIDVNCIRIIRINLYY
jgi:hypothetical protein